MSLIGDFKATVRKAEFWRHDSAKTTSAPKATADAFDGGKARASTTWWAGRPLSEGKNAHKTNTREQFQAALKDGTYNWFEGDIRKELHGNQVELRHDPTPEKGDNLTLKEWLAMGKASGRGLKLDVKDSFELPEIIKETKASGVPSERLMFNLGDGELDKYGKEIRKEFPHAIIAINTGGSGPKMSDAEVNRMIAHAKQVGQPVCFVQRYDRLTPDAVQKLEKVGPVSVWNDTGAGGVSSKNVAQITAQLRREGVTGIIDLRPSDSTLDKAHELVDKGEAIAGDWVDQRANAVKHGAENVVKKVGGFFGL